MTSYRHAGGVRIEIHRADAFTLPADVLLFGKSAALRERMERTARKRFQPYERPATPCGRPLSVLRSKRLPWPTAVSMRYHPRNAPLDALAITPPNPPHLLKLFLDLDFLLVDFCGTQDAERVLILPLSARNPAVVATATIAAIWNYSHFRLWNQRMGRAALRAFPEYWSTHEWLPELSHPRCFLIADLEDPSPYAEALKYRGQSVRQAMHWAPRPYFLRESPRRRLANKEGHTHR